MKVVWDTDDPWDPWEAAVRQINKKHARLLSAVAASGQADVHNLLGQRTVAEQAQDIDALKAIDKRLRKFVPSNPSPGLDHRG